MEYSSIIAGAFALVLALGIAGAFWGKSRKRKLLLRSELKDLKKRRDHLPKIMSEGLCPELDDIEKLLKERKPVDLEAFLVRAKDRVDKETDRARVIRAKKEELKELISELGRLGPSADEYTDVLKMLEREGFH